MILNTISNEFFILKVEYREEKEEGWSPQQKES